MVRSIRRGERRGRIPALFAASGAVSLCGWAICGCAGSSLSRSQSHPSPVTALHDAVDALRAEPRYSLMVTDSGAGPDGTAETYWVDIQKPDRISITGGLNVIAIGSTGYFKGPAGWTTVRHSGESTNLMNE